ncbi:hypothetical protein Sjap_004466 [Stephania japonica]|uniref:Uncharacterized protein n=1 Tax=Stephania japonica TaxID=461633 RepID=A0AAP0PH17_9MAGN
MGISQSREFLRFKVPFGILIDLVSGFWILYMVIIFVVLICCEFDKEMMGGLECKCTFKTIESLSISRPSCENESI